MIGSGLKLTLAAVVFLVSVAIGAPDKPGALPEKQVYPLQRQDGVWWLGIGDVCTVFGARYLGKIGFASPGKLGDGGQGALTPKVVVTSEIGVMVGGDRYEFKLGSVRLTRNGQPAWDLAHAPKLIDNVPCALLEDLCHMLRLGEGEELDGQPTVVLAQRRYRLVQGQPPQAGPGFHIEVTPPPGLLSPRVWPAPQRPGAAVSPPSPVGGYAQFNGLLYQMGRVEVKHIDPQRNVFRPSGMLYGPVIPNRFSGRYDGGNYVKGDQLFLSIVDVRGTAPSAVAQGRDDSGPGR
jgi:hypothetical protein